MIRFFCKFLVNVLFIKDGVLLPYAPQCPVSYFLHNQTYSTPEQTTIKGKWFTKPSVAETSWLLMWLAVQCLSQNSTFYQSYPSTENTPLVIHVNACTVLRGKHSTHDESRWSIGWDCMFADSAVIVSYYKSIYCSLFKGYTCIYMFLYLRLQMCSLLVTDVFPALRYSPNIFLTNWKYLGSMFMGNWNRQNWHLPFTYCDTKINNNEIGTQMLHTFLQK